MSRRSEKRPDVRHEQDRFNTLLRGQATEVADIVNEHFLQEQEVRAALANALTRIAHLEEQVHNLQQQPQEQEAVLSVEVKELARTLDPECWLSYSGKPRDFKRSMEARRTAALLRATKQAGQEA